MRSQQLHFSRARACTGAELLRRDARAQRRWRLLRLVTDDSLAVGPGHVRSLWEHADAHSSCAVSSLSVSRHAIAVWSNCLARPVCKRLFFLLEQVLCALPMSEIRTEGNASPVGFGCKSVAYDIPSTRRDLARNPLVCLRQNCTLHPGHFAVDTVSSNEQSQHVIAQLADNYM